MIDDLIDENFLNIQVTSPRPVKVTFFAMKTTELRGFSGVDAIFINHVHFLEKYNLWKSNVKCTRTAQTDIVTTSIHEYANTRLRQVRSRTHFFIIFITNSFTF